MELIDRALVAQARRAREPRPVVALAFGLFAAALAVAVVLLAAGADRPPPAPVVLLALVAALCVNRFALFPSEHASTAEAAVLLAAVVGCRDDAALLGPLVVGLLVGPLDALHWRQRAFVRMAYNAGNRALAALAAAGALAACSHVLAGSVAEWWIALGLAGGTFVVIDLLLSTALLHLSGERWRAALLHLRDVDALSLPIAWYGGAVALLFLGAGWWAVALALVPCAFLPELVIARARLDTSYVRDAAALLLVAAGLAVLTATLGTPGTGTLVAVVVLGAVLGLELVLDPVSLLPPVVAVVVVPAALSVGVRHAGVAAALAAAVAVATSWCASGRRSRRRLFAVVATALSAALLTAEVTVVPPRSPTGMGAGAILGTTLFVAIGVATGPDRRRQAGRAGWLMTVVVAAVAWSWRWRIDGPTWAVAFGVATGALLVLVAWCGAPTWRSRVLGPLMSRRGTRGQLPVVVLLAVASVGLAPIAGWAAVASGATATAMAASAVHQWRFAPRARALGLAVVLTDGALLLAVAPTILADRVAWGAAVLAVLMAPVVAVAWRPMQRARAASPR